MNVFDTEVGQSGKRNIKLFYNIICTLGFLIMSGYWFYKYEVQDRSIGIVDYLYLREIKDIELPVVSICFEDPFIKTKFNYSNSMIDEWDYLEYLAGSVQEDKFVNIDYHNVTLDISDSFLAAEELWFNETEYRSTSLEFEHISTFNGFWYEYFYKCFSINIKNSYYHYIQDLILAYNTTRLVSDWSEFDGPETKFTYVLHYPGQFLLGDDMWTLTIEKSLSIEIDEIEILKRRNSHSKMCIDHSGAFDTRMLNHHIEKCGCRAPYLNTEKKTPVCVSPKMMKKCKYVYNVIKSSDFEQDCQIISKMRATIMQDDTLRTKKHEGNSTLAIQIVFPDKMRIISQSKEVDVHTLIGNIGGYLGLFLGKLIEILVYYFSKSSYT